MKEQHDIFGNDEFRSRFKEAIDKRNRQEKHITPDGEIIVNRVKASMREIIGKEPTVELGFTKDVDIWFAKLKEITLDDGKISTLVSMLDDVYSIQFSPNIDGTFDFFALVPNVVEFQ